MKAAFLRILSITCFTLCIYCTVLVWANDEVLAADITGLIEHMVAEPHIGVVGWIIGIWFLYAATALYWLPQLIWYGFGRVLWRRQAAIQ